MVNSTAPQPFKKVLEHEVEDMYNVHILEETCRELGIKCRGLEDPANVRTCMGTAEREIERRFGADSKAVWLGTRPDVRTRYCSPGEKPVQYAIPKGAMVMSDLGPDGTLFLFPREEKNLSPSSARGPPRSDQLDFEERRLIWIARI